GGDGTTPARATERDPPLTPRICPHGSARSLPAWVREQKPKGTGRWATTVGVDRARDQGMETDMRLKHHPLARTFALAATVAMIAATVVMAFGAEVGLAADYEDAKHNVC